MSSCTALWFFSSVNLLLSFCFSIIHWKRVWLVYTWHILNAGWDPGEVDHLSRVWSDVQTETGSPSLLHELYGPSALFSIVPSTSLSQRTGFLISFVLMGVIFWHPPPVALLSRDEAHGENRHGNLLCEWKLRNALKIIHRSWVTKVHVHIVLCSHLSQYISLIPIM